MRRRTTLILGVVVMLLAGAGIAVASSGDPSPPVPVLGSEMEYFAADMGVDLETAAAMLRAQNVLSDFAQSAMQNSWYSGFALIWEPPNVRGVLAVTDPEAVVIPDGLPVTVVVAKISREDMLEFNAVHVELLREVLPTVQAVTYDPTSDTVSIWTSEADLSADDRSAIIDLLVAKSPDVFGSSEVRFRISEAGWFGVTGGPSLTGRSSLNGILIATLMTALIAGAILVLRKNDS